MIEYDISPKTVPVTYYVYLGFDNDLSTICKLNITIQENDSNKEETDLKVLSIIKDYYENQGYVVVDTRFVSEKAYNNYIKLMNPSSIKLSFEYDNIFIEKC